MDPTESGSEVVVTRVVVGSHPGMALLPFLVSRPETLFGKDLHIGFPGFGELGLGLSMGFLPVGHFCYHLLSVSLIGL